MIAGFSSHNVMRHNSPLPFPTNIPDPYSTNIPDPYCISMTVSQYIIIDPLLCHAVPVIFKMFSKKDLI